MERRKAKLRRAPLPPLGLLCTRTVQFPCLPSNFLASANVSSLEPSSTTTAVVVGIVVLEERLQSPLNGFSFVVGRNKD